MKAAIHKSYKAGISNNNISSMSEDDVPLGELTPMKKTTTNSNGKLNGVNGHSTKNKDTMSEDEKPLNGVNGKKRKKIKSESESDDDKPLASSSPTKLPPASSSSGTGRGVNGRVNGRKIKAVSYKEESSDDDDMPLASQTTVASSTPRRPKKKIKTVAKPESESDDDDAPLAVTNSATPTTSRRRVSRKKEEDSDNASGEESDEPAPKKRGRKPKANSADKKVFTKRKSKLKEVAEDSLKSSRGNGKEKKASGSPRKKKEEEEEIQIFKWWEQNNGADFQAVEGEEGEEQPSQAMIKGDGTAKWTTLVHSGVLFPPPYTPLPSHVNLVYDGKEVPLPPESEEVAVFFAKLLNSDHVKDPVFQKNFFRDFLMVLEKAAPRDGSKITEFEKCDFTRIFDHLTAEKEAKKTMSKEQKKAEKEKTNLEEERYKTCLLDGRVEKVGNFRVEPPGLFLGRGEHPKKGTLKTRLKPGDIVLNIGKDAPIPVPNIPGNWKNVIHDNTVTWLANWKENINGNFKYVFLAASSSIKGQSDMNKFEKARELKQYVEKIRKDYQAELRAKLMADRQRATAVYFIDRLALRAGNEKGEDEADTVGCCSLRCEHVTMEPPDHLVFDFLGKDSIRYFNSVQVDPQVFKNIRIFKDNKNDDDALFDRVTTGGLNKHLQSYMKGLTAKVFRTYNASITLQQQLDDNTPENASVMEKLAAYNKANRMVAVLCNHQRAVSKNHGESMAKMSDKLRGLKYDRMKLRHALFKLEPKKKKVPEYAELESDLDDEFIERWENVLQEKEIEKAKKKFAKENESTQANGEKPQEESVLQETIEGIKEEYERLAKERGTNKAELKRARPIEKIEEQIETLDTKIKNFKIQMDDKEEGKQIALGTSKINYLDPRITAAWCAKYDVPISKIFSKSLIQKFPWAMGVKEDWKF